MYKRQDVNRLIIELAFIDHHSIFQHHFHVCEAGLHHRLFIFSLVIFTVLGTITKSCLLYTSTGYSYAEDGDVVDLDTIAGFCAGDGKGDDEEG